jgi:FixJ family two-component response regulator
MPHMSGRDLAERLSAARPAMKVLFMSGYTDHAVVHRDLTPGTAFLQKPFTPDVFARKVRQVLDEQAAQSSTDRGH